MNTQDAFYQELVSMNQPLGVISTINNEGYPESASVYYICDKDCNIYFITRTASRKYQNILNNDHVAFVISTESPIKTIQLHGTAHQVTDGHEESSYFTQLIALASQHIFIPPVSQIEGSEIIFIKITPKWIRVGDFGVDKDAEKFTEITI